MQALTCCCAARLTPRACSVDVEHLTGFASALAWLICAPVAIAATQLLLFARAVTAAV
jgi:hypothetical protein